MNIDSIKDGVVIDHIPAGLGMEIYHFLHLDELDCSVALMKNVTSKKMGKKDIIKVDALMDSNLDVVAYFDTNITINVIKNGLRVEKKKPNLPEKLVNIITCKNPRCITTTEQEIQQIFKLTDREKRIYRCIYCESGAKK
ncbi:MAG: aspartate carbamoyltransferase regulatory subunit [Clostridia bacterium]|nr:aspartate carbamoyltransferase regulatory subunit [Clostridia bacterium]